MVAATTGPEFQLAEQTGRVNATGAESLLRAASELTQSQRLRNEGG